MTSSSISQRLQNWPWNWISASGQSSNVPPRQVLEAAENEQMAMLQGVSAELRRQQANDSVWYTFSDGSSVAIEAVDDIMGGDAKHRLRQIEAEIDRDVDVARILLKGPESPADLQLMFDVIENEGVQHDPLLDQLTEIPPNPQAANDTIVRGPFNLVLAQQRQTDYNSFLPTKDTQPAQMPHMENILKSFKDALTNQPKHKYY